MLRKPATTFAGRLVRGILNGIVSGIPGAAQVKDALRDNPNERPVEFTSRLLSGWTTVALVLFLFLSRVFGHLDLETFAQLLSVVIFGG